MKTRMLLIVMASALLWSVSVDATILFVDINDGDAEIDAVKAEAAKRKPPEDVAVVPSKKFPKEMHGEVERRFEALKAKVEERKRLQASKQDTTAIDAKLAEMGKAYEEYVAPYRFSQSELDETLAKLKTDGKPVTSLVLSGHSEGAGVFGRLGSISMNELYNSLRGAGMDDKLRSAYLLGCYTLTPIMADWWQSQFPNLEYAVGYRKKGYSKSMSQGTSVITDFMGKEDELLAGMDRKKLMKLLAKYTDPELHAAAAVLVRGCYYSYAEGNAPTCEDYATNLTSMTYSVFTRYKYATEKNFEDVPTDTSHGSLRDFYDLVQNVPKECKAKLEPSIPSASDVFPLVFFSNVRNNFAIKYGKDLINPANADLKAMGAKFSDCKPLPALDASGMTRHKTIQAIEDLDKCIAAVGPAATDNMKELQLRCGVMLRDLKCVPRDWINDPPDSLRSDPEKVDGCSDAFTAIEIE